MGTISVIATGGTIACVPDETGALVPRLTAADLIERAGVTHCTPVDVRSLDSSSMTLDDVDLLVDEVHSHLADPDVDGVVVTHGTDSLADTAMALDLFHTSEKSVVVTGAMGTEDGPGNLRWAVELARQPQEGVVVCVGDALPARGLIKCDTSALAPFTANESPRPEALDPVKLGGLRIPVIRAWPGADSELLDYAVEAGADGIVVEGLGAGNVSDSLGEAIKRALETVPVVITTSVPFGNVEFSYGGAGGGSTLGALGAIPSGSLRAGQARIALAVGLRAGVDPRTLIGA